MVLCRLLRIFPVKMMANTRLVMHAIFKFILGNFDCSCLKINCYLFNFLERRMHFKKDSQSGICCPVACVCVCVCMHVRLRAHPGVLQQVLLKDVLTLKFPFILKALIVHQVHLLSDNKDGFLL